MADETSQPLIFLSYHEQLNAHPDVPGTTWAPNKTGNLLILPWRKITLSGGQERVILWVSVNPLTKTAYIRSGSGVGAASVVALDRCEFGESAKKLGDFILAFGANLSRALDDI